MSYNLRPSAAGIWTNCAAYPRMIANLKTEPPDSDAAREGTCAAWVADCVLKGDAYSCDDMLGETHKNGWQVDEEMVYYVQKYVDTVRGRAGATVNAEQQVRLTDTIAGTLDSSCLSFDATTLYVDDLKYGYKVVEPYELPQLIIYGYAEYMRIVSAGINTITHVVLGIFQPRVWHPEGVHRTWRLTVHELYQYASQIAEAGNRCQDPNAPATPGNHCVNCKAITSCAAVAKTVYAWYDVVQESRQVEKDPDQRAAYLDFLDRADNLIKAVKSAEFAEAEERLKNNEFIRGWALKDRFGNRKFKYPSSVVHAMTGISPYKQEEMTPPELERAGANKNILEHLTYRPKIGVKIERLTPKEIGKLFRDRE